MLNKYYTILALAVAMLTSCNKEETLVETAARTSSSGNIPVLLIGSNNGGNVTCQEAANNIGLIGYEFSSGRVDYNNGTFSTNFGIFTITTDGVNVSWSVNPPAGYCVQNVAIIVKGGRGANVYY